LLDGKNVTLLAAARQAALLFNTASSRSEPSLR
jgi:hypothetical protein